MTTTCEERSASVRALAAALVAIGALLATGCTRPLLERAIAARGGPLQSLSREVEADVYAGFPGTWNWRFDYRVPDALRWTIETYGEEQSVTFDGETVRFYLGDAAVAEAPPALGDFRSEVRWMQVTTLDAIGHETGIVAHEIERRDLPPGVAAGLDVTFPDGARYQLFFDDADLLIAADGPIVLPTIAVGRMHAVFSDFRQAGGYQLPYRGSYTLDAQPLFDERVQGYVANDPGLTAASFRGPPARPKR
jgi:hypothetical protein